MANKKKKNKLIGKITSPFRRVLSVFKGILGLPKKVYSFLKSVRNELKEVNWLTRKETFKWTSAVLATAIAFGLGLVLMDYGFFYLRNLLFEI